MFREFERMLNLLDWDAGSYFYSRPTLDSKPYQIVRSENGKKSSVVLNALGLEKSDIKVLIERQGGIDYLSISGETKNELLNKTYSVTGRFKVDSNEINEIEWDTKDGLLVVDVKFKEPEKSKVKITMK